MTTKKIKKEEDFIVYINSLNNIYEVGKFNLIIKNWVGKSIPLEILKIINFN
jgi:hypothetical protein